MKKKRIKKKKTIEPCGTMIPTKDYFKFKSENLGVFKKPEIERKKEHKKGVIMVNGFKTYCGKCQCWWYGWGRNICPVCGFPLIEEKIVIDDREREHYRKVIKSES